MTAFLSIQEVVKDFGASAGGAAFRAVDHVSLEIAQGEIFALLGSSGCGKSTLLRMLAGFETPTSGRILLKGQDLVKLPPHERPLNMMFQSYALFPHLTVWDNIAFGLKREGLPKARIAERVEAMLKLVQLGKLAQRKPHQLSGGQQQRVALARSLARQPTLLLLDEPLGALDKKLREETQIELVHILKSVGVTCVMVTHDQEEAMTMASRIAVMSEGRILQVGEPRDLYENPATRFVADFIGNINVLDGNVAVRPEKIRVSRHLPAEQPAGPLNRVQGCVRDIAYFGSYTVYHLQLPSGQTLKVSQSNTERHPDEAALREGDQAWAWWSSSAQVVLAP
ncbi:ABC transporter ATP-binding protein [Aquabacterium sp. CECT 9606]|uniref:ABC transporter ATP-binding protein n=1 Tax=Aquabacterium sp. CECT 9606 TaxID=2845822 RepID=UPI001E40F978|nr:ABC transporter ATP-binding protein [Aquabacterium sp. CECT 9606]CAH0350846.1 Spermidine/putrescine import ATP-binding protein PotA [Aquabacterium sp. CECT 9606]